MHRIAPSRIVDTPDYDIPYSPAALEHQRDLFLHYYTPSRYGDIDPQQRCWPLGAVRQFTWHDVQIEQFTGYIVMFFEGAELYRIIYLDGRPHIGSNLKLWFGDSRGHWEGNTLVIDVTNFTPKTEYQGSRENLHLVERWTRTAPTSLEYLVTIEDPTVWTRPWTVKQEFTRQSDQENRLYYEPRCVEGNYGLPGLLRGARAEELAFAEGRGPHPATKDGATDFVGVEDDPLE
jgi:hypothetical protein